MLFFLSFPTISTEQNRFNTMQKNLPLSLLPPKGPNLSSWERSRAGMVVHRRAVDRSIIDLSIRFAQQPYTISYLNN